MDFPYFSFLSIIKIQEMQQIWSLKTEIRNNCSKQIIRINPIIRTINERGAVEQTCEEPMLTVPGSGCAATWANYSSLPTHTRTSQRAITQFRDKEEEIAGLHSPWNDGLASAKCINRFPGNPRESVRSLADAEASRAAMQNRR